MCNIAFYVTKLGKKIQILEKNAKKEPFLVTIPQKKCYITEFWNDWQKKVIIEKNSKKNWKAALYPLHIHGLTQPSRHFYFTVIRK